MIRVQVAASSALKAACTSDRVVAGVEALSRDGARVCDHRTEVALRDRVDELVEQHVQPLL